MNFTDAVGQSSVIRPEHKDSLIASLRKFPEFSWLVVQPNPNQPRLQGDFIKDFPFVLVKPDGVPVMKRRDVMVLNNTCDLPPGRSSFVSVAPVFDLEKYLQSLVGKNDLGARTNHERDLRQNRISELIFIPNLPGFSLGAIVRLDMISTVASSFLNEVERNQTRFSSFTQNGFYYLLMKINYHISRVESSEVIRLSDQ